MEYVFIDNKSCIISITKLNSYLWLKLERLNMDAARVDELILEGKNSQEIRKKS